MSLTKKETELAKLVVEWLKEQHWEVYQEVQFGFGGGVADIVAVRHGIMWIIECKTAYGLAVLEQAYRWPTHYRSIAVPWARTQRNYRVARDYYQVGVLEVDSNIFSHNGSVDEVIYPKLFVRHHDSVKRYLNLLTELHKTFALAGSANGDHLTPYKNTMIDVRKIIEKNPGCTIGFVFEQLGVMHYASEASFKGNILTALESFEPWCVVDKSSKPCKLFIEGRI